MRYLWTLLILLLIATVAVAQGEGGQFWVQMYEDRNGNAVSFVFDTQVPDRLLRLTAADGRAITLSYDAQGRISQASGPGGRQILLQDPSGNVVELFQPASR